MANVYKSMNDSNVANANTQTARAALPAFLHKSENVVKIIQIEQSCHLTGETNFIRSSSSGAGGGFPGVALRCISSSWYAPKCLDAPERPSMWLTIL